MVCVQCLQEQPHVRASKRFCGPACKQAFHRARQSLRSRGLLDTPVCHWGRFQDYQAAYAGKIDVIITDPPLCAGHPPPLRGARHVGAHGPPPWGLAPVPHGLGD